MTGLRPPAGAAAELMQNPAVKAALDAVRVNDAKTIEDQIRFCEIPAPPFKEEARGAELKRTFEQLGLQAVVEMAIFVGILALGLLYAYRKKVLVWA